MELKNVLDYCVQSKKSAAIFMVNGYQIHGIVQSFDGEAVRVLNQENKTQVLLINNISTITPPEGY